MRGIGWGILHHLGKLNSMGSWCTKLSNYMGGWCLGKFNSMGGWVKKRVPSSSPRCFFWNSPKLLFSIKTFVLSIFNWSLKTGFAVQFS